MIDVRPAVLEDAAAIAGIHVRSWRMAYRDLMPRDVLDGLSIARREHAWRESLTAPGVSVLIGSIDGIPVGFCSISHPSRDPDADEGVAEVTALYVEPERWRVGVGRSLLAGALEDLRARGWECATLWVLAENDQARAFYASFGFAPDGAESIHERSGAAEVRLRALIRGSR